MPNKNKFAGGAPVFQGVEVIFFPEKYSCAVLSKSNSEPYRNWSFPTRTVETRRCSHRKIVRSTPDTALAFSFKD